MPEGNHGSGVAGAAADGAALSPAGDAPPGSSPGQPESLPGGRAVLLIAVLVVAIIFALEVASRLVPPIGEAFARVPLTILVLVVGTIAILVRLARRPPGDA